MPPYKSLPRSDCLNNSLNMSKRGISLPSSVRLGYEDIKYVTDIVKEVLERKLKGNNC